MGSCKCGNKTIPFKKGTPKKATVKKATVSKGSGKLTPAQIKATKIATKKANAHATGCQCTQ